jgi:cytidylate kinase
MSGHRIEEWDSAEEAQPRAPRHGFQGDRAAVPKGPLLPASLTVAVSREAGSRGASIATRAGTRLGWQVYTQELLEYMAHAGTVRPAAAEELPPEALRWVDARLKFLLEQKHLHSSLTELARTVLTLGVQGEVLLIGRGAGFILPHEATLHVRVIAPRDDRVAYLSQWLRLPMGEAAAQVDLRDARRREFIATHYDREAGDMYQYDLLLNSSLLGEELCAELIVQAAKAKLTARA